MQRVTMQLIWEVTDKVEIVLMVYLCPQVVFILTNSADPDDMLPSPNSLGKV